MSPTYPNSNSAGRPLANDIIKKYSSKMESEFGQVKTSKDYEQFKQDMIPRLTKYEKWAKSLGNIMKIKIAEKDRVKVEKYLKIAQLRSEERL